jgi:hypothetical protein
MFKLGLFPHGSAAPDPTPNPVNFDGLTADNTTGNPTYQYIAQQITGINIPITLQLKSNLDPTKGHVYFRVTNNWTNGTFQDYDGPLSGVYGTFTQAPGAVTGTPYNTLPPISFTVNPNDWLIMAVDGTTAVSSSYSFTGMLYNVDDGTYLSGLTGSAYNLQGGIANPTSMDINPEYDDNNSPDVYKYSSSIYIKGIVGASIDLDLDYSSLTWDTTGELYYKVTTTPPAEQGTWSSTDPVTNGYTSIITGGKIFGLTNGKYITFTVAGKLPGTESASVQLLNPNNASEVVGFLAHAQVNAATP